MAHESGVLRVLLDALERRRCLFWSGNVLVELDRDFDPSEEGVGGVTMVLDDEDFAALKALSATADLPQGFRPQDIEELRVQGERYRAARDEGDYAAAPSSSAPERGRMVLADIAARGCESAPARRGGFDSCLARDEHEGEHHNRQCDPCRARAVLDSVPSAPEQVERGVKAMWEAGPTTSRVPWDDLSERQREFARHEFRAGFDAVSGPPESDERGFVPTSAERALVGQLRTDVEVEREGRYLAEDLLQHAITSLRSIASADAKSDQARWMVGEAKRGIPKGAEPMKQRAAGPPTKEER